MKVKELIQQLQLLDQESIITIQGGFDSETLSPIKLKDIEKYGVMNIEHIKDAYMGKYHIVQNPDHIELYVYAIMQS